MNKKTIIGLVTALIILVGMTILLPLLIRMKNQPTDQPSTSSPTTTNQTVDQTTSAANQLISQSIKEKLPYETSDFKIEYSPVENKLIATKKTSAAEQQIDQWLTTNNLSELKTRPDILNIQNNQQSNLGGSPELNQPQTLTSNPSTNITSTPAADQNSKLLIDLLSILLNLGNITTTTNPEPTGNTDTVNPLTPSPFTTITSQPNISPTVKPVTPSGTLVYYSQRDGSFGLYPLPKGCSISQSGCGPTTVAMIVASYADSTATPITIVDRYKEKGYYLGCKGSNSINAKSIFTAYGIKTTDYIISSLNNPKTIDQVASDMRNFIKSGWTIFALADFRAEPGNKGTHFFWIVDVSANNDTWAYDPWYGWQKKLPYNEKSHYPFPKYLQAFGVKR